jgi:hypothetical protein
VVRICGAVPFLERFCHREVEWAQESVIEFIEIYKRQAIIWTQSIQCILKELKSKIHGRAGKTNEQNRR